MDVKKSIENRLIYLEKVIDFADVRLKSAISGVLNVSTINGKTRYYCRETGSSVKRMYLGQNRLQTIRALEEKEYLLKIRRAAEEEKQILQNASAGLDAVPEPDSIYLRIPAERRHLIDPLAINGNTVDEKTLEYWNRKSRKTNSYIKKANYITQNGERVRSKSELIIADRLKSAGIPYQYEPPMSIVYEDIGEFVTKYPDFKVLNMRTGKSYYWEHFGFMDDENYRASSIEKLEKYAEAGLFPGKNLILTFETVRHPLNTGHMESLMKEYLL